MVQIKQMIVSKSIQNRLTYGGKNPVKYIMIHQTANTSKGANAYMHAKLQANGNSRQASWHYQVDADNIYQSFPDTAQAWHAGNRYYNQNSIGIELTVNSDGNYIGTVEHGAELVKYLMNKHNVPISNVIRHKDASGKYCPRELLNGKNGITWAKFKEMVQGKKPSKPSTPKPSKPAKKSNATIAKEVMAGKWGNNPKRKNDLIKAGYDYKAIQAEVNRLAGGAPKPSKPKLKSTSVIADEVIAGKWGNGNDRTIRLRKAGYNPAAIQKEVNRKLGANPKPTFNANSIARQIKKGIDNKGRRIPNGHANRRKHFGLTNVQYQQVRSIVNRIM